MYVRLNDWEWVSKWTYFFTIILLNFFLNFLTRLKFLVTYNELWNDKFYDLDKDGCCKKN